MGTLNTNGYIGNLFVITTDYDDTEPSAKHSSTSEYLSLDIDPSIEIGEAGIRGGRFDHSIQAITFLNIEEVNMFNCRFESSLIGIRAFNVKSLNVR